jgi:hypothetical protein
VDVLLLEQVRFTCPWTQKPLTSPAHYDLDHLLPLSVYPVNELWNLVPVDRYFNQRVKRDRVPASPRLLAAEPLLAATYAHYQRSAALVRAVREDAGLRFGSLPSPDNFPRALAQQAVRFVEGVAGARLVGRF